MTRAFSLSVILLGVLFFSGLAYWHIHALEQANLDLVKATIQIQEQNAEAIQEDIDIYTSELEKLLEDESKELFRPLLRVVEKVREEIETYQEDSEQFATSSALAEDVQVRLQEIAEVETRIIAEHHLDFDISDRYLKEILVEINQAPKRNLLDQINGYSKSKNPQVFTWAQGLALEYFLLECREKVLRFSRLSGGRSYIVTIDFPLLLDPIAPLRAGDKTTARFAVGTYTIPYNTDNYRFFIDGKSYGVGDDGMLEYDFVAKGKGEQELKVELQVTNPLTGEIRTSEGSHSYVVQ